MKLARPTVDEERWMALAERYPALRADIDAAGLAGGWKATTALGRLLGAVLALLGVGMLGGVLALLPAPLLVGGLLLIAVAEGLVAQRRVYRSGVEEVVYLCGAVAVVAQLLVWSKGDNTALGVALIAAAVLLVGWRLLNPVFTTLGAAMLTLSVALTGEWSGGRMHMLEAAALCAALSVAALLAGARVWCRPAHDQMFDGLVIVMPWLAYGWIVAHHWRGDAAPWLGLAVAFCFSLMHLVAGVRRRRHAPLVGALGSLFCMAHALHQLLPWPHHWQLIFAGAVVLTLAVWLERRLRGSERGITSSAIHEPEGLDLAQLAGVAGVAPAPAAASQPGFEGQGGGFGGGGASGRF